MQGQRGAIDSLPEYLAYEHGSFSNDAGVVDQQISWNNMQNPPPGGLSDHISPTDTNGICANSNQEGQNLGMCSISEGGSGHVANQTSHSLIEPKTEHEQQSLMKPYPEPPESMLSLGDFSTNIVVNHGNSGSSSDPHELEGGRLPCKRKAVEQSVGQSSGTESLNLCERSEGSTSTRHAVAENPLADNETTLPDLMIPRLGLGVGGVSSENPLVNNTHRNIRLRMISASCQLQQDPLPAYNIGQSNISPAHPSLRPNPVDLRSMPVAATAENSSSSQDQPLLRVPALRRNLQASSRWNSRANRLSDIIMSGDGGGSYSDITPTNILDHPIFVQPNEIGNATQNSTNRSLNGGDGNESNAITGVASSSPSSVAPTSAPHRSSPHYAHRRFSEFLRRSILSFTDSETAGGQNSNNAFSRISTALDSSSSSQSTGIPHVDGIQGHHHQHQLRQPDAAFGNQYLSRAVAGGSVRRIRLASEIRSVLDLIRRGEVLRFEDMILDQSVFNGVADIHDRHRDMRLDIDNMSYEELLALEEHIGNVNTGLNEEIISNCLKQKKYEMLTGLQGAEPCCVCQEEYKAGDDLGALVCGHDFHASCIKQWLLHKNSCPVCKSTASSTNT